MALMNSVAATGHTVADEISAMEMLAGFGLDVHPERCVRLRNRHSRCSRCADACTSGAIRLEEGAWHLSPEVCVGCGTCATVCPTCALEARHPADAELLRHAKASAAANGGVAVFACERVVEAFRQAGCGAEAGSMARVICLSRLEETLIYTLVAAGIRSIRALCADCENCPRKQGRVSVEMVAATVGTIANAWGADLDYTVTAVELPTMGEDACSMGGERPALAAVAADARPASTPDFAADTRGGSLVQHPSGGIEAVYKPVHVQKDGTLPHFVPERRRRLLDALETLGEPAADTLDTRLWGHVIIDFSRCMSCKMCAVFCPTGAICKYTDEHGVAGIEHYVAECVHCCLCRDVCPGHAISCVTEVPARQLANGETERYPMADPDWSAGPDQILQRMRVKIGGNSVEHSY